MSWRIAAPLLVDSPSTPAPTIASNAFRDTPACAGIQGTHATCARALGDTIHGFTAAALTGACGFTL